ncbi:MAG: glycerate kinase [Candidatus Melainabacteria bacterium]|nr:glycerate kinase [Candidatus Melainabacteria bacterium]
MRIVVAPCAYKGTFSPTMVARAMAEGVRHAVPEAVIEIIPLADGGDGTIEALYTGAGGQVEELPVDGALNEPATAKWLSLPDVAVVELASACGIAKLTGRTLKPLEAHTHGLGQVIKTVVNSRRFRRLVIAVGGSASTDGGAGALTACGVKFLDANGKEVAQGGGNLGRIAKADVSAIKDWLRDVKMEIATDVHNPLTGPNGAARIFGPQKGALESDVELLENNLLHFAEILVSATGRGDRESPGAGAAGGTAFGLASAFNAQIISGFAFVKEILNLESKLEKADLIITGEGKLDMQTISGKAIGELVKLSKSMRRDLIAVPAIVAKDFPNSSSAFKAVVAASHNDKLASFDDIARATTEAIRQSRQVKQTS